MKMNSHLKLALANQLIDYDVSTSAVHPTIGIVARVDDRYIDRINVALGRNGLIRKRTKNQDDAFVTGLVTFSGLKYLAQLTSVKDIELAAPLKLGRPLLRRPSAAQFVPAQSYPAPVPSDVVIGVVDTGFPFAHSALMRRSGSGAFSTRVLAVWDQDSDPDFAGISNPAKAFGYGAVVDRGVLNDAIARSTVNGRCDEDACYRRAGYGELARRKTHGAHVLGLATGSLLSRVPPYPDFDFAEADRADVLAVQLPRALIHSPSRAAMSRAILDGVAWMLDQVPQSKRLVVVVAYGSTIGPHDGTSLVEQALDSLLASHGDRLRVCFAAGNSSNWKVHAQLEKLAKNERQIVSVRVPPTGEASTFLELWASTEAKLSVRVRPAGHADFGPWVKGGTSLWRPAAGSAYGVVNSAKQSGSQNILMRIGPTLSDGVRAAAPVGDWDLEIISASGCATPIDAYLSRGRGGMGAVNRGKQARFVVIAMQSKWCIKAEGTINAMACGQATIGVGAYIYRPGLAVTGHVATAYSSAGPSRDGRSVVDFSRPGDDSTTLRGVAGIGTRSAITFRMSGTSPATAQVGRIFASVNWPIVIDPQPSDPSPSALQDQLGVCL